MKKFLKLSILLLVVYGCSKDDEVQPDLGPTATLRVLSSNNTIEESSSNSQFTFSLTNAVSESTTVSFQIEGNAINGEDYESISNSITIPAGSSSETITIVTIDDGEEEDTETINITLTSVNNSQVTIGSQNQATITILDNTTPFVLQPEDTTMYMVNPNATPETVALFYNLKTLASTNIIVGQQDAFSRFYNNIGGDSDIKKTTGSDPGLLGSDFMFITDDLNDETQSNWYFQQEQMIKSDAIEAYNKGMVNIFAWHLREPYQGEEFYTSNMTEFQKNNAFISILPGGENHEYYKGKLQKVAQVAGSMVGADGNLVPFIFRPFHEFDGHWFWWGADYCTPQQFKELWQFTVHYLRDTLNVNNILFSFSPDNLYNSEAEYLNRYPGDAYVDVLGMDNYSDLDNMGQSGFDAANEKLQIISNLAKDRVKIAALTETAYFVTPGQNNPIPDFYSDDLYGMLTENDVELGFMMFWINREDSYCTPVPGLSSASDFIDFVNMPEPILQNQLPQMYVLPN